MSKETAYHSRRSGRWTCFLIAMILFLPDAWAGESALLRIEDAPAHGLVATPVDLTWLLGDAPASSGAAIEVKAALRSNGAIVPAQFVADPWAPEPGAQGMLVLQLPGGGSHELTLAVEALRVDGPSPPATTVRAKDVALSFTDERRAGPPAALEFRDTGKDFASFVWNDRVHDSELGCFHLRYDAERTPMIVSKGALCTVVRVPGRYCKPDGTRPASQPEAVYDWYVFNELPLVLVTAHVRQTQLFAWEELHFLELNFPDDSFPHWAGGEPASSGKFTVTQQSTSFSQWGALIDASDAIGMFGGPVKFYDGRGGYGIYLHSTWQPWQERTCRLSTWLWLGHAEDPAKAVQHASQTYGRRIRATLTRPALRARIETLRAAAAAQQGAAKCTALWQAALAEHSEAQGRLEEAEKIAEGGMPPNWKAFAAGELKLVLRQEPGGVVLHSLFDLGCARELLAPAPLPLFTLTLRQPGSRGKELLSADAGWKSVNIEETPEGFAIAWEDPVEERFAGIRVSVTARADHEQHAWRWAMTAANDGTDWSVWQVVFPQLALGEFGGEATVLFPRGPGEERSGAWREPFRFQGRYPSGWCSMQLMAAYAKGEGTEPGTGLYFALHDPFGSTKEIVLASDPERESVRFAFEHPAPDMGRAGNGFTLCGEAVWQLLRGDWFDAAMIYKAWARNEARWWPELTEEGREDTPLWMRELCAWTQTGGAPGDCVPGVKAFAAQLGVPLGYHWYNWHEITFDNDYPHYFPTKAGFAEAVRDLQENQVYIMPYINGRLWDTHDKETEDVEFTSVALPAVSKDERGEPYTEVYGSKEADGKPVRLGVMCPSTDLWQRRVKDIVLRLQNQEGVNGVYIDQIAAAAPTLCMDADHHHPLGGGHWWNEGYWKMLDSIRQEMQKDRMLTTECNAEPFVRWMDGYLTWHWQYDGQVPVFPAIYGGTLQMFGRAYRGGPSKDLALRMKAGQQLVFGEQIGWLNPSVVDEADNAAFFRHVVRLRWRLRRYFYAGEMARPPALTGSIPRVRADWQWSGEWPVSTDAVLTGAWRIPAEKRLVLLFVNVSDDAVTATLDFHGAAYGVVSGPSTVAVIRDKDGPEETMEVPSDFQRTLEFPARCAFAWEWHW